MPTPSKTSIYAALAGNVAVGVTKFAAFFFSGSSAMLVEAIHSVIDTCNQGLLLFGIYRGGRPPDEHHPFGYGLEAYFWTFVVALLIFAAGGVISIYEGVIKLLHPTPVDHVPLALGVIGVCMVFEIWSLVVSLRAAEQGRPAVSRRRVPKVSFAQSIHFSADPAVFEVLAEDAASILGLVIAFLGVIASAWLGWRQADGAAAIAIGVLLVALAGVVVRETHSLLTGEAALPSTIAEVREILEKDKRVDSVCEVLSMQLIAGIDEAYLAVVRASDFVNNLLVTSDGNLRTQVFEENVRSFLGWDNSVNKAIQATLQSGASASRFPVLNNGITIVSPDVRLQGNTLHLKNFQIVNGCQTSNVLFESRGDLGEIMVNIKVVETKNEDVFSELVRATNSQSKVDDAQFLSLRPVIKRVEQYFNTYNPDTRLYFERRDRQFVGQDVPAVRIYSVHNAAKCVAAMYCNRPELASRYPKAMYAELTETIFAETNKENIFYASCLTMYRLSLLVSNNTIPQNMKRFKWHILPLVRAMISGKQIDPLNSRRTADAADAVITQVGQHSPATTDIYLKAVEICESMGQVTSDRLKRQAILAEMLSKI